MKKRQRTQFDKQVLLDHIRELQKRLLVCVAVLFAAGTVGYLFYSQILNFLRSPLHSELYYSSPTGSFNFVMKICLMVGIAVALPAIVYNLIMFLRPAFKGILSLRRVYSLTFLSVVLAIGGAAFGFYAILPGALRFFSGFQVGGLSALITADSYLSFVTNIIITFMIVFQIPLFMILSDNIKPIPPRTLLKMEKYVIAAGLIISAVVPFAMDLVTCLLIALPIVVLYNLSVVIVIAQHTVRKRHQKGAVIVKKQAPPSTRPQTIWQNVQVMPTPPILRRTPYAGPRQHMDFVKTSKITTSLRPLHVSQKDEQKPQVTRHQPAQSSLRLISDIRQQVLAQ